MLTIARAIRFAYRAVKLRSGLDLLLVTLFVKDVVFLPENKDKAQIKILDAIKKESD
jgi:hypothetical protein